MKAYSLIRPDPFYRRDAFAAGLAAAGYEVRHAAPGKVNPGDVLCIWNRYIPYHDQAVAFESAGGVVVFAVALSAMSATLVSKIETPVYPGDRERWCGVLADNQWDLSEIRRGDAWRAISG